MLIFLLILEVLIEKGSAAVSCDARNRTKTVCRTTEHMNFLLKSITYWTCWNYETLRAE